MILQRQLSKPKIWATDSQSMHVRVHWKNNFDVIEIIDTNRALIRRRLFSTWVNIVRILHGGEVDYLKSRETMIIEYICTY